MPTFELFALYFVLQTVLCFDCAPYNIPEFDEVQQCCDSPTIIQTEIVHECETEGASVLEWAECYFKQIDAIVNGKPSTIGIKALATSVLSEHSEWNNKFDEVVDRCSVEVAAKDAETRKRLSAPPFNMKNVNSIYAHLIACIDAGLWLECPDAKRVKNPRCTEIQEYMQECLKDFPPPYFTFVI